jgi:hypothetical protein
MITFLDIETIPGQGCFDSFLTEAKENFKAPSDLSKAKACADLGLTGDDAKYTSRADAIVQWEEKFSQEKAPEVAEQEWRKTSFNGAIGELVSIAWAAEDDEVISVQRHAAFNGDELLLSSEAEMLEDFYSQLEKRLNKRKPFFIGQFIGGFDLPFLFHRSVILRVRPPFDLPFNGRHDSNFYDTQIAWAGYKGRMSQDNLCKALDIKGKPDDIDGSKVWDFVKAGDVDRVAEYNRDDVEKNREIYKRINFIDSIGLGSLKKAV